jgi:hypothetical protein
MTFTKINFQKYIKLFCKTSWHMTVYALWSCSAAGLCACTPRRRMEGLKVQHHSFLTLTLNVGGLSASHFSRFTSGTY